MKKQFKLFLEEELVEQFEELAQKYGIKSANYVAQEVLSEFTEFWVQLQEAKNQEKHRLKSSLLLNEIKKPEKRKMG